MIFEEFDRLEPDLTLQEIIARRKRLKIPQTRRKPGGFKDSEVIAERLRQLREALTHGTKPKPPITHMKRSVLLRRVTEFNARLDSRIHGSPSRTGGKKVTEFSFFPGLAGGVVGSGVGQKLSGKKYNPATKQWEDDEGKPVSAPNVSSWVGAGAGAGAGMGVAAAHKAVMRNYGGEGGAGEAYRNVARNVGSTVGEKVSGIIGPKATTAAQDIYGVAKSEVGSTAAEIAKKLKRLKGAGASILSKAFARPPRQLVEFEARIDAIVFKKKVSEAGRADKEVIEFAQVDEPKKSNKGKLLAGAYLGGLATPSAARVGRLLVSRRRGPLPSGPGSYLASLSPEYKAWLSGKKSEVKIPKPEISKNLFQPLAPGAKIPPDKVADFLKKLHASKIKI